MGKEKILILGFEQRDGGLKNALYYASSGCEVRLTDLKDFESLGEAAQFLESHGVEIVCDGYREEDFIWADKVVKTSAKDFPEEYLKYDNKAVSSFSELLSSPLIKQTEIILITGLKGKTTTASAVSHTLKTLGKTVHTCGNLGRSAYAELALLNKGDIPEYLICEFSARQLKDALDILGDDFPEVQITLITGTNMENEDAVSGKELLFGEKSRKVICPLEMKSTIGSMTGRKNSSIWSIEYLSRNMSADIPRQLEKAYAVLTALGVSFSKKKSGLKSFRGVPNQSEIILMNGEVIAVNDSSATIPESVVFAYSQFSSFPVHLICGGTGRTLDPSSMLDVLPHTASITLLDGSFTRDVLIPRLDASGISYSGPFGKMSDAVSCAFSRISPADGKAEVVLLSPGAMAYEFFTDEFDRGEQFALCCREEEK